MASPPPVVPPHDVDAPRVDFSTFIMSLGSSALMHLGLLPPPDGQSVPVNLEVARETIDVLALLEEKTRGNLSDDERQLLSQLLFDLRLKYVETKRGRS